jgi:hypothetical protein
MSDDNAPAAIAVELFRPHVRQISRFGALGVPACPTDWDRGKSRDPAIRVRYARSTERSAAGRSAMGPTAVRAILLFASRRSEVRNSFGDRRMAA